LSAGHPDDEGDERGTGLMNALPPLPRDILHCIGNTSLLALRNIVPGNGSRQALRHATLKIR
jgi:hypothetical protein